MSEIRTLIVDDSSVMRKIVERSLRQAGLDTLVVFEAGSGTDGLELLKGQQVDLILSDINMPLMDGLEFLRQLRAQNLAPGVPLVIFEAGSGTDGLELLKAQQVDLILTDINMPSMDGLEFLRQLRAQNLAPGVPVVMITTESSEEHVKQAILSGAQGYIRKPFTAEQVKERVLPLLNAA